jgi:CheY-like chemotaxis protein
MEASSLTGGEGAMAEPAEKEQSSPHYAGLVVDDDKLMRESVSETLSDLGVEVHQASDGLEGLEVLEHHPEIAVVVTDIAMPRLDGIGFAQRARALHPDLKVLFVSGRQAPPASETFLSKPFHYAALVSAVRGLLASAKAA